MASFFDTLQISSTSRYTSMRVHGNCAQVQLDNEPDSQQKHFTVERIPQGTLITSNYNPHFSVHLSIPTPLTVEKTESMFVVSGLRARQPIFSGSAIDVVHIEIYLTLAGVNLGTARAMDATRLLAQGNMSSMQVLYPAGEKYYEEGRPGGAHWFEINKRVYLGLGVMFEAGFVGTENQNLLVTGAKAIFWS